jgi:MinD-like ATPase involved in chromosome partitioning or flagellar assembly
VGDIVADDREHGAAGPARDAAGARPAQEARQADGDPLGTRAFLRPDPAGHSEPAGPVPGPGAGPAQPDPPRAAGPGQAAGPQTRGPAASGPGHYRPEYYGPAGYRQDDYAAAEPGPTGYGQDDYGPAGYGAADYGAVGLGQADYSAAHYGATDYSAAGFGPADYGVADYVAAGYGVEDYGPAGYGVDDQEPADPDPVGYGSDEHRVSQVPPYPARTDSAAAAPGHGQVRPDHEARHPDRAAEPPPGKVGLPGAAEPGGQAARPETRLGPGDAPASRYESAAFFGPADDAAAALGSWPGSAASGTDRLTPELLLPGRRRAPAPGWRRMVYQATGGLVRIPLSAAEVHRQDMISRARAPVVGGHHRVAIMSLKGGVGKTTTTMGLGSTLAALRGDRVIAVDANPDRGTLSDKVPLQTAATIRDLLNERAQIRRYADVRTFTSQAPSRLEILASDRDPTVSVAFSEADYRNVCAVLEHYYSICLTDCGTGLMHSAMAGVLQLADQIVLVSTPSVDGARSASATLDWLEAHGYADLVAEAVMVLCAVRPRSRSTVDLNRLEEYFAARCRAVTRIPYDSHLEEGAEIELDLLSRSTADAYLELAAIVGDGLARPRSRGLVSARS